MISGSTATRSVSQALFVLSGLFAATMIFSQSRRFPGELGPGHARLGRYFDTYTLQLTAGERIVATLSSYDFDAYLVLESPEGKEIENDDYGDGSDARIDALIDVPGIWKIKVSSYEDGEQGEYYDSYKVFLERHQRVVISMRSEQFDPFLVLKPLQGRRMLNDDYEVETESRLDFIAESSGQYEIFATSYAGGELEEFGYCEMHPLFLEEGQRIILEMISDELDTLLMVDGPDGFYTENDDYNDQTFISRIELFAPVQGEYIITAASYDVGAEGAYTLKIYSFGVSGLPLPNTHQLALAAR